MDAWMHKDHILNNYALASKAVSCCHLLHQKQQGDQKQLKTEAESYAETT
jgi:hypothetical protein